MFKKYMHIERYGNSKVGEIEIGDCFIFPKIDGTNASVWYDDKDGQIHAGSRTRELSLEADNAGFYAAIINDKKINAFLTDYPFLRLFGEWLVPHSLKTYNEDAWRKFYVFDVFNDSIEKFISYKEYQPILEEYALNYIPAMAHHKNTDYEKLMVEVENNTFLIPDGKGSGEGIVIKNYDYQNQWGHTVWAKIITSQFKEKHQRAMGAVSKNFNQMVEQDIINKYVDKHLIEKTHAKICIEEDGWDQKYIPRLFSTIYHDLITEEIWDILKKMKNPAINFKTLYSMIIIKVKKEMPELF